MTGEFQISVKPNLIACKIISSEITLSQTSEKLLYLEWELKGMYDEC